MRSLSLPTRVCRTAFSRIGRAQLRRQCAGAMAVAYVTDGVLQRLYPPPAGAVTVSYSSVELPDEAFRSRSPNRPLGNPPMVVVVATMSQRYKGHDVLLRALASLRDKGTPVAARLVGSGRYQPAAAETWRPILHWSRWWTFVGQTRYPRACMGRAGSLRSLCAAIAHRRTTTRADRGNGSKPSVRGHVRRWRT